MAIKTRLRVHLVGDSVAEKAEMAAAIRCAMVARHRQTVVVPDLSDPVRARQPVEDVGFFMALESEHLRYEADRDTKAKHLVFVDSLVDRIVRMRARGVDADFHFLPRLRMLAREPGHVFVYGPSFDRERTGLIARLRIPVQAWSPRDGLASVLEAVEIGLRSGSDE